jgi:hypothetical protein
MKKAVYTLLSGEKLEVEYDETAPCKSCSLPVEQASMAGTVICSWCDCGVYRDGSKWHTVNEEEIKKEARRIYNEQKGFIH